jgi:hypothetical protein
LFDGQLEKDFGCKIFWSGDDGDRSYKYLKVCRGGWWSKTSSADLGLAVQVTGSMAAVGKTVAEVRAMLEPSSSLPRTPSSASRGSLTSSTPPLRRFAFLTAILLSCFVLIFFHRDDRLLQDRDRARPSEPVKETASLVRSV